MDRERRRAQNELLFRELNERLREVAERTGILAGAGDAAFLCECADPDCTQRLRLTREEYEEARGDRRTFLLAPGHEAVEIERVVADRGGYLLVRKTGEAGQMADAAY